MSAATDSPSWVIRNRRGELVAITCGCTLEQADAMLRLLAREAGEDYAGWSAERAGGES